MSSHIHLILQNDDAQLPTIIRDLKSHLARQFIRVLENDEAESRKEWMLKLFAYYAKYLKQNSKYVIWRKTNKPIALIDPELYERCKTYIHQNPVKAQLVVEPHHWLHSSASEHNPLSDILGLRFQNG